MVYKQYTMSGSRGVPFGWRCPECGKLSVDVYKVSASSTYDDRGFRVKLDERKSKAETVLSGALDKRAMQAILDAENRRFDKMHFSTACAGCGARPAWSDIPNQPPKALTTARDLSLAAAIILVIIGGLTSSEKSALFFQLAGVAAALLVALLLVGWLIRRHAYAQVRPDIEKLQPENLPRMARNGPDLLRRLTEDGLLSRAEAEALGGASEPASWQHDTGTLSDVYRRYAEEDRKSRRKKRILLGVLVAAALAAVGVAQVNGMRLSQWQRTLEDAQLFASNAAAGSKYVVYEKRVSGPASYQKKYLSADQLAGTPGEVGYIVVIEDTQKIVGTYGTGIGMGAKNAYRIHTTLRLYDCHTGLYVGSPIELTGGQPPSSIKSTQSSGTGSRPKAAEITSAINRLIQQAKQYEQLGDDGMVTL